MGDNRNFAALEWVTGEIDETLKQARQALEAYVENPNDSTRIRFCLTHIHQVHGSLQMVEFYGAALMAEEMESLAEAMMNEKVNNLAEAQEVLMRAILQFPLYLDKVKSSRRDHPVMVLPLLNDLRTVRGEALLTETNLFTPNLAAAHKVSGQPLPQTKDNAKFVAMMQKLAQMYQYAAAGVLRGVKLDENIAYLVKVFDRLNKLTQGTAKNSLWHISLALAEGLANDSIEPSASIKNLLRQLNREIKILQKHGVKALRVSASDELLKNLLYYVARAGLPEAEKSVIAQVYRDYDLADSMPEGGELESATSEELVAGPDPETMRSVVAALKDELDSVKHVLDVSLSGIEEGESVEQALPIMQRVADTMAVLGIGHLRKYVLSQCDILAQAANQHDGLSHDLLMSVASSIIEIENSLDALAAGHSDDEGPAAGMEAKVDQAQASVLRESRNGLEHAKDAIIEYIASQWNSEHLEGVPATLREIRGGLDIIPLHRPAKILGACARYIEEQLLQQKHTPDWSTLDTLADAITSVEYYLERISSERRDDDELLLSVAEESVESLGYAVTAHTSAAVTDTNHEHADAESVLEKIASVEDITIAAVPDESAVTTEEIELSSDDIAQPSEDDSEATSEVIAEAVVSEHEISPEAIQDAVDGLSDAAVEIAAEDVVESSLADTEASDAEGSDEEDEIDDEILEIFIEEAEEVTETIAEFFPLWAQDHNDNESLTEFRRAFHTLKGSGRMVGANDIGELAWSIENMLNRIIDGTVTVSDDQCQLIENVRQVLPALIVAFRDRQPNPEPQLCERYMAIGEALAKGPLPAELSIDLEANDGEQTSASADSDDEQDSLLWEIFGTEALGHLQVVEDFIAEMEQSAPIYSPPSDAMQRALHTLKGSAHMADVTPIAELATPLESFAKELRSYQINIDDDILQLLRDGVKYTRSALQQIEDKEPVEIPQLPQFCARVAELRELQVAPLVRQKETLKDGQLKIDPKLLEIFMAEEMNLLLDAEQLLEDWSQGSSESDSLKPLQSELLTLHQGATHANLPGMAELSEHLHKVYVAIDEGRVNCENAHAELIQGHEQLLDMVDAVAAGQTLPDIDQELASKLLALAATDESAATDQSTIESDISDVESLDGAECTADEVVEHDEIEITETDTASDDALNIEGEVETESVNQDQNSQDADDEELVVSEEVATDEDEAEVATEIEDLVVSDDSADDIDTAEEIVDVEVASSELVDVVVEETQDIEEAASAPILADLPEDFDEEIVEIFLEEANELLEEMEHAIHSWESDFSDTEPSDELKRILHTLKGGARLAGMVQVGDLSHDFETMIIDHGEGAINDGMMASIHSYQDRLLKSVENVAALLAGEAQVAIDEVVESVDEEVAAEADETELDADKAGSADLTSVDNSVEPLDNSQQQSTKESAPSADIIPFAKPAAKATPNSDTGAPASFIPPAPTGGSREVTTGGAAPQLATKRSGPQEVVKVSAELLEELVNLAGETSISRGRMEEQVNELGGAVDEMESTIHRLQEQLRRLDIETEAQISFRQEQLSEQEEFDPLEMDRYSALQQLSRSLIESASDLMDLKATLAEKARDSETLLLQQSRINTELQEGLMRSRMVPFSRLVPRLRRIVRQVATELGKQVSFELDNVEGELDRSVLERMVAPLEHMLRNAVDHGIEMPEDRTAADKPETGRVILSLSREGGDVILRLVDDGRGINLERVREKAIERGLMTDNAALSDQDIMQFILHAGFSTAETVSQISGRGVGMDVVHSEIKQLGGAMFINSRQGQGTEFTVRLPFTVSVNRALMVQIGDDRYAIPLNTIEGIVRVSPFELEHYYQDEQARFEYAGENYQVRYLGSMLNANARPKLEDQVLPLPVVLVRSAEHTVAVQVDRLMGSREIVVKTLGPQFGSVMGLSGATVMGDGSVVVILDPHAMIRKEAVLAAADKQLLEPLQAVEDEVEDATLTVMVVDDSVTVRKVTSRFLEREGYNVITAKDGREALTTLQDHLPDVMLLDIEMPRMDGFEVAKNIRSSSRLKDIPIIMITSRTGDKHRQRAMDLGVNKYMGKPFQEEILLGNIRALSGEAEQQ